METKKTDVDLSMFEFIREEGAKLTEAHLSTLFPSAPSRDGDVVIGAMTREERILGTLSEIQRIHIIDLYEEVQPLLRDRDMSDEEKRDYLRLPSTGSRSTTRSGSTD